MNIYIAMAAKSSIKAAKILDEWRSWRGCIDSHTAKYLTQYKESVNQESQVITASINLGITSEPLKLTENGLVLPHTDSTKESLLATWEEIEMIGNKKQGCYALYDDDSKPWHISTLSGNTGMTHKCLINKREFCVIIQINISVDIMCALLTFFRVQVYQHRCAPHWSRLERPPWF